MSRTLPDNSLPQIPATAQLSLSAGQEKPRPGEEPFYRLMFERSATALLLLSEAEVLDCNGAFLNLLGYADRTQVLSATLATLSPARQADGHDSAEKAREIFLAAREKGSHRFEWTHRRADGSPVVVETVLTALAWEDRYVFQGAIRDVTDRKRLENALHHMALGVSATTGDAFFRSLVQYLSRALGADYAFVAELDTSTADRDGGRVRTTAVCAAGEIVPNLEYSLRGTPCADVAAAAINATVCAFHSGVQRLYPDDRLLAEMGVEGYVGTALFDSSGRTLGLLVVLFKQPVRDLPVIESTLQVFAARAAAELERRKAHEALQRANDELETRVRIRTAQLESERALLEAILQQMPAGVIVASAPDGAILLTNPQTARIWRVPPDSLRSLNDLGKLARWHPDGTPVVPERMPIARSLYHGEIVRDEEILVLRDGSRGVLLVSAAPIRDENGVIVAAVSTALDITELKQTEEALRRLHNELEMQVQERTAELAQTNRALQAEVQERRRAEQVSRGQTAALAQTLDALTAQPDVDTFLEHLIQAIREQLQADGIGMVLHDPAHDVTRVRFAAIGGQTFGDDDYRAWKVTPSLPAADDRTWQALLRDPRPFGIYDIKNDPRLIYREQFLTAGAQSVLVVPLMLGERPVGYSHIYHTVRRQYGRDEVELARALAQQATLAVQLDHLAEQGQEAAVLKERNRLAREIHDTLAQGFAGIIIHLQLAEAAMSRRPEKAMPALARARDLAKDSLAEARRSVWALRANALEADSLPDAFRKLVEAMTEGTNLNAAFSVTGTQRPLPRDIESHLLRIGQEAINNAVKYAQATAIRVVLTYEDARVSLEVCDDGVGFAPGDRPRGSGFGHVGMRERIQSMCGDLTIESAPGQGTRIVAAIPLPAHKRTAI